MRNKSGFTFIDVLVGSALMLIIFVGIFTAYQLGLKVVAQSKNKIVATAIAGGELEQIKNLTYDIVGVLGGFPEGNLESSKTTTVGGIEYTVDTRVDYVVDSADGVSAPDDVCPNDYKKVEVKVSWAGIFSSDVKLITDISPETLAQECDEEGGILLIQVFDAFGVMIPSPLIEIKNPSTDVVLKTATPVEGSYFFSLSPSSYKVVVSKAGHSSSRTYGIEEIANPEKPHLIVIDGQLTESSFSIDDLSSFNIEAVGPESLGYPAISNVNFDLMGAKVLGTDISEETVFKYSENFITNELGTITIPNLEWDLYTFVLNDLDLITIESPSGTAVEQPISLVPETTKSVRIILQSENSLLVIVKDSETEAPIFSADVRVYSGGYDVTQYTDEDGETYFIPMEAGIYNIEVSILGYNSYSGSASGFGDALKTINLQRIE